MPDQVSVSTAMAESFPEGRQILNFKYGEFAIFKSNDIRGEHHFADVGKMIELGRENTFVSFEKGDKSEL